MFWSMLEICAITYVITTMKVVKVTSLQPTGPTCFQCDREVHPTMCSKVVTCGANEKCALEKGLDLFDDVVYWSGCKDVHECASPKNRRSPNDVRIDCLECCDGNFCNSAGCGQQGFSDIINGGSRMCFNCHGMAFPFNCSEVKLCSQDEMCYFEAVVQGHALAFNSGCKLSKDCPLTLGMDSTCHGCCQGNFCNSGCHPYSNLMTTPSYITKPPSTEWITITNNFK